MHRKRYTKLMETERKQGYNSNIKVEFKTKNTGDIKEIDKSMVIIRNINALFSVQNSKVLEELKDIINNVEPINVY